MNTLIFLLVLQNYSFYSTLNKVKCKTFANGGIRTHREMQKGRGFESHRERIFLHFTLFRVECEELLGKTNINLLKLMKKLISSEMTSDDIF